MYMGATPGLFHSDFAISRNISRLVIKPLADRRTGNAISMAAVLNASTCTVYTYISSLRRRSMRRGNKEQRGEGGQIKHVDQDAGIARLSL